jgi:hypothetical protein
VQWNAFADEQRALVWSRLHTLLDGCVSTHLQITDEQLLRAAALELRVVDLDELSLPSLAFEVLRRSARRTPNLATLGLEALADSSPAEILAVIEQDFYQRSLARYERDFRTLAS